MVSKLKSSVLLYPTISYVVNINFDVNFGSNYDKCVTLKCSA